MLLPLSRSSDLRGSEEISLEVILARSAAARLASRRCRKNATNAHTTIEKRVSERHRDGVTQSALT